MKEKVKEILKNLDDRDVALLSVGDTSVLSNIQDHELKSYMERNMDIVRILATEELALRRGFKVEETDVLKLKKEGEYISEIPLYDYNGELYTIYANKIFKLVESSLKKTDQPSRTVEKPKPPKRGVRLP